MKVPMVSNLLKPRVLFAVFQNLDGSVTRTYECWYMNLYGEKWAYWWDETKQPDGKVVITQPLGKRPLTEEDFEQ